MLCVVLAAVVAPPISEPRVGAAVVFCVPKVIPPPLEAVPRGFPVIVVEAAVPRVPRVGPAVLVAWVVPREIPTGLVAAAGCPVKLKPAPAEFNWRHCNEAEIYRDKILLNCDLTLFCKDF